MIKLTLTKRLNLYPSFSTLTLEDFKRQRERRNYDQTYTIHYTKTLLCCSYLNIRAGKQIKSRQAVIILTPGFTLMPPPSSPTLTSEQFMRVRSEAEGWSTGMDGQSDDRGSKDPSRLRASILGDCWEKRAMEVEDTGEHSTKKVKKNSAYNNCVCVVMTVK